MTERQKLTDQPRLTTQQQIIWDYLKAGRTLTNKLAIIALGIGSLSSRIAELRKMGYEITDEYETDPFERRFLKYRSPCRDGGEK